MNINCGIYIQILTCMTLALFFYIFNKNNVKKGSGNDIGYISIGIGIGIGRSFYKNISLSLRNSSNIFSFGKMPFMLFSIPSVWIWYWSMAAYVSLRYCNHAYL